MKLQSKKKLLYNSKTKKLLGICAPNKFSQNYTCFSKKALINIINKWNNKYKDDKIVYDNNTKKKNLWISIDKKMKNKCTNEYCWINQDFVDKYSFKNYFKPKIPRKWKSDFNTWLNTLDIENVMKQYEQKYDNFHFIGPVPIDFDAKISLGECVINELCNIKLKSLLNKGKTKLGIIFNLDKHDQPGSHWVSFFADFDKNEIYYFDSYGYKEPSEVTVLMKRLQEQGKELNRDIKLFTNDVRHQYKNSECGIYSINFIVKLLENNDYDSIKNNKIDDDTMQENRNVFYMDEDNL